MTYEREIPEMLDCGLSVARKVMGGKWNCWILDCVKQGIKRPSAIHREMKEVSPRIINLHLKELEEYGIIYKQAYAEIPLRVEYSLTAVRLELLPILAALEEWGIKNREYILSGNHVFSMP